MRRISGRRIWFLGFACLAWTPRAHGVFERGGPLSDGARVLALGGAGVGLAEGLDFLDLNPAALLNQESPALALDLGSLMNGKAGAWGLRAGRRLPGGEVLAASLEPVERRGQAGISERKALLAAALPLSGRDRGLGLALKPLWLDGPGALPSGGGFSLDLGGSLGWNWSHGRGLRAGFSWSDFAGRFRWAGSRRGPSSWLNLGLAAFPSASARILADLGLPSADDGTGSDRPVFRGGLEYRTLQGLLILRGGIQGSRSHDGSLSAGFGLNLGTWTLSYGYGGAESGLGPSHRLTWSQNLGRRQAAAPSAAQQAVRTEADVLAQEADREASKLDHLKQELAQAEQRLDRADLMRLKGAAVSEPAPAAVPPVPAARPSASAAQGPKDWSLPGEGYKPEHLQLYHQGLQALSSGDFQSEMTVWQQLSTLYPDDARVKENLESAKRRLKRLEELKKLEENP